MNESKIEWWGNIHVRNQPQWKIRCSEIKIFHYIQQLAADNSVRGKDYQY